MKSFLSRVLFNILLFTFCTFSGISQSLILSGTHSDRVDINGLPDTTYYGAPFGGMTNWDSSPYQDFHLTTNGNFNMNFRLLFPQGYDLPENTDKKYPMILMLHGAGESGRSWPGRSDPFPEGTEEYLNNDKNLVHGGKQHLDAVYRNENDPRAFPGFVLFPQNETGRWNDLELSHAIKILELLIEEYNVDPNRIYVHGLSMGALGVWEIVFKRPDLFAAWLPMSGAISDWEANNNYDFNKTKYVPMWIFQGGVDTNPRQAVTEKRLNDFRQVGATPRYTLYPDLGHGVWNNAYNEPDFFSWMLQYSKLTIFAKNGITEFCEGELFETTLGISAGFDGYRWKKDGTLIAGANTHEINVAEYGQYSVQIKRGDSWSEWSEPIEIKMKPLTPTPAIAVGSSTVLPALDGSKSVTLTAPEGFAAYHWSNGATTPSITVSNSGAYTVSVTEEHGCASLSSPAVTVSVNAPDNINPPTNFVGNTVSETAIELQWTHNADSEVQYEVYRGNSPGGPYSFIVLTDGGESNFIDTDLTPGATYYYKIRGVNASGRSAYSLEVSSNTSEDMVPPTPPSGLTVTGTGKNEVSLSWSLSEDNVGIDEYKIYRDSLEVGTTHTTDFTVGGLLPETLYRFTVRAVDVANNFSQASNQVSAMTVFEGLTYQLYLGGTWDNIGEYEGWPVARTGQINNFNISNESSGGIRPDIEQDYFAYDFEGYVYLEQPGTYTFYTASDDGSKLFIGEEEVVNNDGLHGMQEQSGSIFLTQGSHPIKVQYFERTGGENLEVYYSGPGLTKQLIPDNALKSSGVKAPAPPLMPGNLTALGIAGDQIDLQWVDNSSNESGFEIYQSLDSVRYQIIHTTDANDTTYSVTGLSAVTRYYYKIRAVGSTGESAFEAASAATLAETITAPGNLAAIVENEQIKVSWQDLSDNETGFILERSEDEVFSSATTFMIAENVEVYVDEDENILPEITYYYRLRAYNDTDTSSYSSIVQAELMQNQAPVFADIEHQVVNEGAVAVVTVSASDPDAEPFDSLKIVVLGSSTAAGIGASSPSKSWVGLLETYMASNFSNSEVLNLAVGGYTSNDILPGSNPDNNITKAITQDPDLIIVNLPSNDEANGIPSATTIDNFRSIQGLAEEEGINIFFTTTQPRNFGSEAKRMALKNKATTILQVFGYKAIEIYSELASENLTIKEIYNADGIHVNDSGHNYIYNQVKDKIKGFLFSPVPSLSLEEAPSFLELADNGDGSGTLTLSPDFSDAGNYEITLSATDGTANTQKTFNITVNNINQLPVAGAGADRTVVLPVDTIMIHGYGNDSDGTIESYLWQKISGPPVTLGSVNSPEVTLGDLVEGVYVLALTVTDNDAGTATDSVTVIVEPGSSAPPAPGLNFAYYQGAWDVLPDFNSLSPVKTGTVSNFSLKERKTADKFAFVFDGYIEVPTAGEYTFYTYSDEGSKLYIGGNEVVDNDGMHSPQERSGTIYLTAGKHPIKVTYFERWGQQVLDVLYAGPGISKQAIPDEVLYLNGSGAESVDVLIANAGPDKTIVLPEDSLMLNGSASQGNIISYTWSKVNGPAATLAGQNTALLMVSNMEVGTYTFQLAVKDSTGISVSDEVTVTVEPVPAEPVEQGLAYAYYEGAWDEVPDFSSLTPVKTGFVSNFSLRERKVSDKFAFVFEGFIEISTPGEYNFHLYSDEGSKLFIGSNEVVDNDGRHTARERSGHMFLLAGKHPIRVTYFERWGDQVLEVQYDGPGIQKQPIPDEVLSHNGSGVTTASATRMAVNKFNEPASKAIVYPNSFENEININFVATEAQTVQISVSDQIGRVYYLDTRRLLSGHEVKVDLRSKNISAGIYFLTLNYDDGHSEVVRLLKIR